MLGVRDGGLSPGPLGAGRRAGGGWPASAWSREPAGPARAARRRPSTSGSPRATASLARAEAGTLGRGRRRPAPVEEVAPAVAAAVADTARAARGGAVTPERAPGRRALRRGGRAGRRPSRRCGAAARHPVHAYLFLGANGSGVRPAAPRLRCRPAVPVRAGAAAATPAAGPWPAPIPTWSWWSGPAPPSRSTTPAGSRCWHSGGPFEADRQVLVVDGRASGHPLRAGAAEDGGGAAPGDRVRAAVRDGAARARHHRQPLRRGPVPTDPARRDRALAGRARGVDAERAPVVADGAAATWSGPGCWPRTRGT